MTEHYDTTDLETHEHTPSDALVLFGATGDLARKKIYPSLHELVRRGKLKVPVIAVARSGKNTEYVVELAREAIKASGKYDEGVFQKLAATFKYVDGDYQN